MLRKLVGAVCIAVPFILLGVFVYLVTGNWWITPVVVLSFVAVTALIVLGLELLFGPS